MNQSDFYLAMAIIASVMTIALFIITVFLAIIVDHFDEDE